MDFMCPLKPVQIDTSPGRMRNLSWLLVAEELLDQILAEPVSGFDATDVFFPRR